MSSQLFSMTIINEEETILVELGSGDVLIGSGLSMFAETPAASVTFSKIDEHLAINEASKNDSTPQLVITTTAPESFDVLIAALKRAKDKLIKRLEK